MARVPNQVHPGPSLTEQVTEMMKRQIVGGFYKKGDVLPSEQKLAMNFGVSRAVVREAISRLKANGLVEGRQGRGAYIASTIGQRHFQIEDEGTNRGQIQKIIELRMSLEVEAAGLAAVRRDATDLKEMKKALDAHSKALEGEALIPGVKADLRFHAAVCTATKNTLYLDFFTFLNPYLASAITITLQNSMERLNRIHDVESEHQMIYAAIESQDEEAARSAARRHITNTMERFQSLPTEELASPGAGKLKIRINEPNLKPRSPHQKA